MGSWLNNKVLYIERVLVSPYIRAKQTLLKVREKIKFLNKQDIMIDLISQGNADIIACCLKELARRSVKSVLIISHSPLVGYLVSALCPKETPPMFATSSIACINFNTDISEGKLEWNLSPSKLSLAV